PRRNITPLMLWNKPRPTCCIATFVGHVGGVHSCAFGPGKSRIASLSTNDNTLRLWDAATGRQLLRIQPTGGNLCGGSRSCSFSPDGRLIAAAVRSRLVLWDVETGIEIATIAEQEELIASCEFSPDGNSILVCAPYRGFQQGSIAVYKVPTGEVI